MNTGAESRLSMTAFPGFSTGLRRPAPDAPIKQDDEDSEVPFWLPSPDTGFASKAATDETPLALGDDIADDISTTFSIAPGQSITSQIDSANDTDYFRITLSELQTYVFTMERTDGAGGINDAYIELRDASGNLVAFDDDGGIIRDSVLMYNLPSSAGGTYYLVARGYDGAATGGYTISAEAIETRGTPAEIFGLNGKFFFSWEEAAIQISRTGSSWASDFGQAVTVTYAFRSTEPGEMPDDTSGFSRFNEAQIAAAEAALQAWSQVANITFQRVGAGTTGDAAYSDNATILFANYSDGVEGASAFAYLPSTGNTLSSSVQGDIWVNSSIAGNNAPDRFNSGVNTLIHEIGHALGLSHPGDYDADPDTDFTYADTAEFHGDTRAYTVMSYFPTTSISGVAWGIFPGTPQMYDIAAIQRLYGVNNNTRNTDTTYGFNSNADRSEFQLTSANDIAGFTIWDGGGNDTLDLSGYNTSVTIDLREEHFSTAGPGPSSGRSLNNIAIARGAVIENAVGGSGEDYIGGNAVANRLEGGAGNDTLRGENGDDLLFGGADNDILYGDAGNDQLHGDGGIDQIRGGEGNDIIHGGDQVDILQGDFGNDTLYGDAGNDSLLGGVGDDALYGGDDNDSLLGEDGNDRLYGDNGDDTLGGQNGDDELFGGAGNDTLSGGGGNDMIDGGEGDDTASAGAYQGDASVVRYNGTLAVLSHINGTDRLTSIEYLEFPGNGLAPGPVVAVSSIPEFRALDYIAGYNDLIGAFGFNGDAGVDHFITSGFAEGRIADGFDGLQYIATYGDLIGAFGADPDAAVSHFIASGYGEGRSRDGFDEYSYLATYGDLRAAFGTDTDAATAHWIANGFSEGRTADGFDALRYIASNDDLIAAFGINDGAGARHYVEYGATEARATTSFDALQYIASFGDLINAFGANIAAATEHFIANGFGENRSRDDFDAAQYLANYADLQAAFGTDETAATLHFITNGYAEGRTDNAPSASAPKPDDETPEILIAEAEAQSTIPPATDFANLDHTLLETEIVTDGADWAILQG